MVGAWLDQVPSYGGSEANDLSPSARQISEDAENAGVEMTPPTGAALGPFAGVEDTLGVASAISAAVPPRRRQHSICFIGP